MSFIKACLLGYGVYGTVVVDPYGCRPCLMAIFCPPCVPTTSLSGQHHYPQYAPSAPNYPQPTMMQPNRVAYENYTPVLLQGPHVSGRNVLLFRPDSENCQDYLCKIMVRRYRQQLQRDQAEVVRYKEARTHLHTPHSFPLRNVAVETTRRETRRVKCKYEYECEITDKTKYTQ